MSRIVIGSDKSGYALRIALEKYLTEKGYELTVYGPKNEDDSSDTGNRNG